MEFNDNVLVKRAMFGLYGEGLKSQAKRWLVENLVSGNELPVQLDDCFEAFEKFDEIVAEEFAKKENLPVLWTILDSYDERSDRFLLVPRIACSVFTRLENPAEIHKMQAWFQVIEANQRMVRIMLEKAQCAPQILKWILVYCKKRTDFSGFPDLIAQVKDIVLAYPEFVGDVVELINYLSKHQSMPQARVRLDALEAMTEIYRRAKNNSEQKAEMLEKIDAFVANLGVDELYSFFKKDVCLPYAFMIRLSRHILNSVEACVEKLGFVDEICRICREGLKWYPNDDCIAEAWNDFVWQLAQKYPKSATKLFWKVSWTIDVYVQGHVWGVALMNWNPGMNFQNYSAAFQKLTLTSLGLANLSGHFCPRAFLTALNIWAFDDSGKYDSAWFEQYVAAMPQNPDTDSCWNSDLRELFEHLALLYRYRTEFQKQDAGFIAEQAKVFVRRVMSNYALTRSEIERLKTLCANMKLDIDIEAEVRAMELRLKQIAQKKEQERQYLLALFS